MSRFGATWTPTRRRAFRSSVPSTWPVCIKVLLLTPLFFAECPRLDETCLSLQGLWGVPPAFWASQLRDTAKSGWITLGAPRDPAERAVMQVVARALGV